MITSGVSLVVQLALLLFSSKEELGLFSLLMSYVLIGQMASSALFGSPLITATASLDRPSQTRFLSAATRLHHLLLLPGLTAVALSGALLMSGLGPAYLAATAALCCLALSARDLERICSIVEHRPVEFLFRSVVFAFVVGLCLVAAFFFGGGTISAFTALLSMAAGALVSIAGPSLFRSISRSDPLAHVWRVLYQYGKWGLPGVAAIWIQNNLYLTIVAALIGMGSVADLSAARLLAMPYMVCVAAMSRFDQAALGRQAAAGSLDLSGRTLIKRAAKYAGPALAIGIFPALIASRTNMAWNGYVLADLLFLGSIWLLFASVYAARNSVSSVTLALGRYKKVFHATAFSSVVSLSAVSLGVVHAGEVGAVSGLILGEIILAASLFLGLRAKHP